MPISLVVVKLFAENLSWSLAQIARQVGREAWGSGNRFLIYLHGS